MNKNDIFSDRKILINTFADFILTKVPKDKSFFIEIADCTNFWVVKGKTNSNELIDLKETRDEFSEIMNNKNLSLPHFNIIDLIQYDVELEKIPYLNLEFYNNTNTSVPLCSTEENNFEGRIITSNFPHGYSINYGRDLYFYAKHISYNLQTKYFWNQIRIKIFRENNDDNLEIYSDCQKDKDVKVESAVLDCFDFNFENFSKKLEQETFWELYLNSDKDPDFVKELNPNLLIF